MFALGGIRRKFYPELGKSVANRRLWGRRLFLRLRDIVYADISFPYLMCTAAHKQMVN